MQPFQHRLICVISTAAFSALGVLSVVNGQNLGFDPGMTGTNAGGSGVFDATTTDFNNNGTDQAFTKDAQADFFGAAGAVTVGDTGPIVNPPEVSGINVNTSSGTTETFNNAGAGNAITVAIPTSTHVVAIDYNNSSDVNFNTTLIENETTNLTYDTYFLNDSGHNVTYNNITVAGMKDTATNYLNFSQAGSGTTTITGDVTNITGNDANGGQPNPFLRFGANGANSPTASYVLSSTASVASNIGVGVNSGTLYVQTSNIATGTYIALGGNASVLTDAAGVTIGIGNIYTGNNDTIGGHGAFDTTFSTPIANYNGPTTLTSDTTGGKVHFTGVISQNNGVTVTGPGIVSFEEGNYYNGTTVVSSGAHLLLNNAVNVGSGSATGLAVDPNNMSTSANQVQVNGGGILGGMGSTVQAVVSVGATSTFSPGDMKVTPSVPMGSPMVASTVGKLTLAGGLMASSGATFNFDLNGPRTNGFDTIEFNGSNLALIGVVTFNFTDLGGALDAGPYTVLTNFAPSSINPGTANSTFDAAAFVLNAPAGYVAALDPSDLLPGATSFSVDFTSAAIPEPTTWVMIMGSPCLLALVRRCRSSTII